MRDTTDRPEAIDAGTAELVSTDKKKVVSKVNELLSDNLEYELMSKANTPYGDRKDCEKIEKYMLGS